MITNQNKRLKSLFIGFVTILFLSFTHLLHAETDQTYSLQMLIEKFEEYRTSDPQKALRYARMVAEWNDSIDCKSIPAALFDRLAQNSEYTEYSYDEALRHKEHAVEIYRRERNDRGIARAEADLGRLFLKHGDYHKAYNHSLEALEYGKQANDSLAIREAWMTIEQIDFFYYGDVERAMEYNSRVSDYYDGATQARQAVSALNNRFRYPLTPDQMKALVDRCEQICREHELEEMLINVYLNAALQELRFNDVEACGRYLEKAEPLVSDFKEEGYYYSTRGFYHLHSGQNELAIEDTKRSIELLKQGDFASKNVHSYFLLQELYRSNNSYREAYEALMQFAEIYTRQHNSESIVELSQLINELELDHAREQHRRTRQLNALILLILILGVIILATGIALFYTKVRLERKNRRLLDQQAEQELRNKNEIIRIQKLQQFQEQRNMTQLTEELNSAVKNSDDQKMRNEIKRIIRHLQKNSNPGADWVEVEKTMVGSNDAFFEKLLKEYPNLTKNERKLCTFIHLNLSTKEISKITHQSMGSINIARTRLRQKFGLTGSDQSLIAFLDRFNTSEKAEE